MVMESACPPTKLDSSGGQGRPTAHRHQCVGADSFEVVGDVSVCWLPISLRELELLNRGRKPARTSAMTADPAASAMTTRKAFSDGSVAPPMERI